MRIAHFIDTDGPGGAETMLLDLCAALDKRHEMLVVSFGNPWLESRCAALGMCHCVLPFRASFKRVGRLPFFVVAFARWLRHHRIDLLHSHLLGPIFGGALAAQLARIPHVGTLHDIYMVQHAPRRIYQLAVAARLGTQLITVSDDMLRFYDQYKSIPSVRLQRIHNWYEPEESICSEHNPWRHLRGGKAANVKVVAVGRLVKLKRFDWLIQSISSILIDRSIILAILGDGPERENLTRLVPSELQNQLVILGHQSNVRDWLFHADVFIQVSETEGLSRSILEAVSFGLPCIVTDVGGNRELVVHQETGYLVPCGDSAALAGHLADLCDDIEKRQGFGQRGAVHAGRYFNKSYNVEKYSELYESYLL